MLCPRHLNDLAFHDGPNVGTVLAHNRAKWSSRLEHFLTLSGDSTGRKGHTAARDALPTTPPCRACDEEATAVLRQSDLLGAQLRDPDTAHRYSAAHGICLYHALQ